MQFTLSTIAAVAAILPSVSAHLFMSEPKMFRQHMQAEGYVLDPLDPSGSNFPCQNGTPDDEIPDMNKLQHGKNTLKIEGSAVHGGGSAQMVITYDFPPPKDETKWRVLTSYEGDHPVAAEGNLVSSSTFTHSYTVWDFLPRGKATVAWSWYNAVGNREHYMKCATVSIGGSAEVLTGAMESKALKKLPTMFRANSMGDKCIVSPEQSRIDFKNPGNDVVGKGDSVIGCDTTIAGTNGNNGEAPANPSEPDPPTEDSEGTGDSEDSPVTAPSPTPRPPVVEPEPAPSDSGPTPPGPSKPAEPQPEPTPAPGGSCTEGEVVCNGDGTWSQCGSGQLHNMGGTGAGRICQNGGLVIDPAYASGQAKRSIRFSVEHRRRRH